MGGFVALVVLESVWTVSGLLPTHYYALLPWVFVVAAEGWIGAARAVRARLRGRSGVGARLAALAAALGAGAVLTATFAGFLAVDLQYHRLLGTTGGYFTHSDAIYRLADYLDRNGVGQPVAMDWGIARNVQILTQGRVNPVEVFLYAAEPPPLFDDLLYKQIVVPGTVFIFHPDDSTIYRRRPRFQYWLDRLQKQAVLQQEILQRNGKVLFQVYAVP
ncbi:MAG: hypothetical protein HY331_04715 [Chloroflexi bacterium]|nr:hypothetical protein [Chloroflexota bacterium]